MWFRTNNFLKMVEDKNANTIIDQIMLVQIEQISRKHEVLAKKKKKVLTKNLISSLSIGIWNLEVLMLVEFSKFYIILMPWKITTIFCLFGKFVMNNKKKNGSIVLVGNPRGIYRCQISFEIKKIDVIESRWASSGP